MREGWHRQDQVMTKTDYAAGGTMGSVSTMRYLVGRRRSGKQ
jgi:hypothetical protein